MDAEAGEFQDWEVLQPDSGSDYTDNPVHNSNDFQEIDAQSEGMIQTDYFSMDPLPNSHSTRTTSAAFDVSEVGSENSDNPSWIDPNSDTRYPTKDAGEFWSDSSSDRSDDRKFYEFRGRNEKIQVGFDRNEKTQVGCEGVEEISGVNEKSLESFDKIWSVSGHIELDSVNVGDLDVESESGCEKNTYPEALEEGKREKQSIQSLKDEGESVEIVSRKVEKEEEEEKKKSVLWWKVPIDLLRYCLFRASPVWTFSVAAAVMGFVILGRRLYKMKKKTRALEINVTMDDKKISQFMSRAARLNEAFSVVKRVPVVRPSLPAVGVAPWPVMSLR
ncbi:hypothetical protein ACH5RR_033631 [Cinchona calisaya]|uniref:DUF6821 domain-containing protein n=1 Tax=Cinchona calisaya TaxID=153742 RepID=A0ABD2YC51_9GENT